MNKQNITMINFLEYCNSQLKTNHQDIVDNLKHISDLIDGTACFDPSLKAGKGSSFVIYSLQGYFKSISKSFTSYLEVGSLYGGSLCALASSGFKGTAYGCDIFKGYYGNFNDKNYPNVSKTSEAHINVVKNNVQKMNNNNIDLHLIKGSSLDIEYQKFFQQKNIKNLDVLYIDGLHTTEGCSADWDLYSPCVKKGGIILVDNYEMKEVQVSVNQHIMPSNKILKLGVWNNSTWIGIKK